MFVSSAPQVVMKRDLAAVLLRRRRAPGEPTPQQLERYICVFIFKNDVVYKLNFGVNTASLFPCSPVQAQRGVRVKRRL